MVIRTYALIGEEREELRYHEAANGVNRLPRCWKVYLQLQTVCFLQEAQHLLA